MTRVDILVLELLDEQGIALPPKAITFALREKHGINAPSEGQVSRRLREQLSDYGLVDQPYYEEARGYYAITNLGERFLHNPDAEPEEFIADIDDDFSSG